MNMTHQLRICFQVYLFNDSPCVDYLKLKFYDVVVTVNSDFCVFGLTDFCVFGLTVVCFHYLYSLFYMIIINN